MGRHFWVPQGSGWVDKKTTIYVVDDEERNVRLVMHALKPLGYNLHTFSDGKDLLAAVKNEGLPDLILSDVMMPHVTGYEVCESLKGKPETATIPIVLITGLDDLQDKVRGLEAGADDFLQKPFHPLELRARVKSLLRIKSLNDQLEEQNLLLQDEKYHLERAVRERTVELEELTLGLVAALEGANKLNDVDTGNHIKRVCHFSEMLARNLKLERNIAIRIGRYASLHDVGKVGISDAILKKPGKLTADEWAEMKRHTVYGYELLRAAKADSIAQHIALCHHEKYDGTGYPYGLKGNAIPMEARIVALADVFDALTSKRCYKEAFPNDDAISYIRQHSGSHFDPVVVDAMFATMDQVIEIQSQFQDTEVDNVVDESILVAPPSHLRNVH